VGGDRDHVCPSGAPVLPGRRHPLRAVSPRADAVSTIAAWWTRQAVTWRSPDGSGTTTRRPGSSGPHAPGGRPPSRTGGCGASPRRGCRSCRPTSLAWRRWSGCGSGYVSAWLARRGARPVGVDASARQLDIAHRLQGEFGLRFPLVQADAERVPLGAGCTDLVISEYGASVWCDPYRRIPEAARLLRPCGRLVFLAQSTLARLCLAEQGPATDRLVRDLFGLHRVVRRGTSGTEYRLFALPHGEWIRLMARCGLAVEDLIEVQVPLGATNNRHRQDAVDLRVQSGLVPRRQGRRGARCVWLAVEPTDLVSSAEGLPSARSVGRRPGHSMHPTTNGWPAGGADAPPCPQRTPFPRSHSRS
jgi:SAM-dependent methyltransferase